MKVCSVFGFGTVIKVSGFRYALMLNIQNLALELLVHLQQDGYCVYRVHFWPYLSKYFKLKYEMHLEG